MRTSSSFFHGLLPLLLLLLSIIAATIIFTASPPEVSLISRVLPKSPELDLNVPTNGSHILESRVIEVKPASNEDFNKAKIKGYALMCWMRNPAMAGSQAISTFTRFEQLQQWGWTGQDGQPVHIEQYIAGFRDPGLISLLGPEGDAQSKGHKILLQHMEPRGPVTIDGKVYKYPATEATYENVFNTEKGVIVGEFNWSPAAQVAEDAVPGWNSKTDLLPDLHQLSDVMWLCWAKICSQQNVSPSGLHYIVSHNVVNHPTEQVLARVLQIHWKGEAAVDRGQAPAWPGKLVTKDMEGFVALIGTPSIWGTAYLLVQRSGILGRKQVKSIRVWNGYPDKNLFYQPSIIMELEDVRPDN